MIRKQIVLWVAAVSLLGLPACNPGALEKPNLPLTTFTPISSTPTVTPTSNAPTITIPGGGEQVENPIITFIASKVKNPNAPFALIIQFKVKAGKEQAFEAAFEPCIRETRKEPGSTAYYLNRDSEDPDVYVMYEQWKNIAAATDHVKQPYFLDLAQALEALVDSQETKVLLVLD